MSAETTFPRDFELIRWVVYVFLGGAVNALILETLVIVFIIHPFINAQYPLLIAFIVAVFLAPVYLSLVLTKFHPRKQIVPPFYLQLVQLGWFLGFTFFLYNSLFLAGLVLDYVLVFLGGTVQDRMAVGILGVAVEKKNILPASLKVYAKSERIAEILSIRKFRLRLRIVEQRDELEEKGRILFRSSGSDYPFAIELEALDDSNETLINMVFFEKKTFYVGIISDDLREFSHEIIVFIKDILQRQEYGFKVEDGDPDNAESLTSLIMDEMSGLLPQFGKMSRVSVFKSIAFVGAVIAVLVEAIVLQNYDNAIGGFALILLYIAFELRPSFRRRRTLS